MNWTDLIPVIAVVIIALALAALAVALRGKKPFEALDRAHQRFDDAEDALVEHQWAEALASEADPVLQDWDAVVNDDRTEVVFFDPAAETEVFSKLDDSENAQVTTDPAPGENTEPANDRGRHELAEDGSNHQAIPFLVLYARLRAEEAVNARARRRLVGTATAMAATVALPIYESLVSEFGEPLWSLVS